MTRMAAGLLAPAANRGIHQTDDFAGKNQKIDKQ